MKPESAKALIWTAVIITLLAFVIMSPAAAFVLLILAVISVAIPSAFASGRLRLIAALLLVASVALSVAFYPGFERERQAYAQRSKERATQSQTTTPKAQEPTKSK